MTEKKATETILVADDEEILRSLAHSALEAAGYEVLLAEDGAEAVEIYLANRERVSLLLLDIMMPCMGGGEAAEQIRALDEEIPVVFMTGYSAEIVRKHLAGRSKLLEEGSATLLQKPYSVGTLERTVREALDRAKKRREE